MFCCACAGSCNHVEVLLANLIRLCDLVDTYDTCTCEGKAPGCDGCRYGQEWRRAYVEAADYLEHFTSDELRHKRKSCYLTTAQLADLELACVPIKDALGRPPYLVGSTHKRLEYRDVDVRSILPDEQFDALFGRQKFWGLWCLLISHYLSIETGLAVDYQVQRQTEANEKYGGEPRNPLGMQGIERFAGGGDATQFTSSKREEAR